MIAITGATGFIGKNIVSHLKKKQHIIKTQSQRSKPSSSDFHYFFSLSQDIPDSFLSDCHALVHLACSIHGRNAKDLHSDYEYNVLGSIDLFERYIKLNPNGKIIYASTGGAMYDTSVDESKSEESPVDIKNTYVLTKIATENALTLLCKTYNYCGITLRISNPYGAIFDNGRTQGLIGVALNNILTQRPLIIFENQHSTRDFLHISDMNLAFEYAINAPNLPKGSNTIINIGSGLSTSIIQIVTVINKLTRNRLYYELQNQNLPATYNRLAIKKAADLIQWAPNVSLSEGIEKMILEDPSLTS